jgi:hypothetical protein
VDGIYKEGIGNLGYLKEHDYFEGIRQVSRQPLDLFFSF